MNCQPTTEQKQRRARKLKAPTQLGLFELPPAPPPAPAAQSPRAVAIAAETTMQAEAKRALNEKAAKAGKPVAKQTKPRPKVLTS